MALRLEDENAITCTGCWNHSPVKRKPKNRKRDIVYVPGLVSKTCQILLSKLIFPNTKFEEFTQDMLDIANSAPGISGSDAASAASIKMLIRYLVENLSALQK